MPKVLTIRKQAWINKFEPDVVRGLPLNPNAANEHHYYEKLRKLIIQMTATVEYEIEKLFKSETGTEYFAEDKSISAQAKILSASLTKRFNELFATNAKPIAESMAGDVNKSSSASLHASLQKLSGGLSLPTTALQGKLTDILAASIAENVSLIKSISQQYLAGVEGAIMRSITTGNGLQDLIPYLANHKGITLRRARFIASDQTSKAFAGLCTGRMQSLGITEFEWIHSGGSNHPRKSHIAMSGNIYSLKEGAYDPEVKKYILPSELPGCRCRKLPIIKFGGK